MFLTHFTLHNIFKLKTKRNVRTEETALQEQNSWSEKNTNMPQKVTRSGI